MSKKTRDLLAFEMGADDVKNLIVIKKHFGLKNDSEAGRLALALTANKIKNKE